MKTIFPVRAWNEHVEWRSGDRKAPQHLNRLIGECRRAPQEGTGKPEPLRPTLSGWWSRRIGHEHWLVYRVSGEVLEIAQCCYHY